LLWTAQKQPQGCRAVGYADAIPLINRPGGGRVEDVAQAQEIHAEAVVAGELAADAAQEHLGDDGGALAPQAELHGAVEPGALVDVVAERRGDAEVVVEEIAADH